MRLLSYVLFFIFVSPVTVFAASAVILVNPPALYFSKPDVVSIKQVQDILTDAVDRSSSPNVAWSVESKNTNVITAKLVANRKHTAFVDISYSPKKISIKYKSSINLKHKKLDNTIDMIHPNYHKWVNYFVQKIKYVTEKNTQYSLIENDPSPRTKTKGGEHFVILAQAEPGNRDDDYELSFTMEKFSASLLKRLSSSLQEIKNDNVTFKALAWGEMTENLLQESYKKEVSKSICATYKADKILYANAPAMPGGQGSRDITYYLYNCATNRKIKQTYEIDRNDNDIYGYQIAFIGTTADFIENNASYK